jgi:hypothetical protein
MKRKIFWLTIVMMCVSSVLLYISLGKSERFENFPVGHSIQVDYSFSELSQEEFTEREKRDQVKDWLLLGVLFKSGLDTKEINDITYDLPINRYGYVRPVYNLEYGETRSKYIGDGEIVALLPKCLDSKGLSKENFNDYLANIADEHRKNLNEIPKRLYIFRYEIDLDNNVAFITREEDQKGEPLFTETYSYIEKTVGTLKDFSQFMDSIDDITYAHIDEDDQLVLGGRKINGRTYGTITVEDVAAIWQADLSLEPKRKELRDELDKINSVLNEYRWKLTPEQIIIGQENIKKLQLSLENINVGFSLDPEFDSQAIADLIEGNYEPALKRIVDNSQFDYNDLKLYKDLIESKMALVRFQFYMFGFNSPEIVNALKANDVEPLLKKLLELKAQNEEVAKGLLETLNELRYQKARYEGDLLGTEVGMHFFYTDLLAKLWTMNFENLAPDAEIPDFVDDTKVKLAKVYEAESDQLDSVRLWFGSNESKFQLATERRKLIFLRNISEIFGKSTNSFTPRDEVQVSARWAAALDWWNNHYEEVAEYEPEYERLNEILKWTVMASWLNCEHKGHLLGFLSSVPVKKGENGCWFPQWAASGKYDLKFKDWSLIRFYPKDDSGIKTETMPILNSPMIYMLGKIQTVTGGISGESNERVRKLISLPEKGNKLLKRSDLNYQSFMSQSESEKGVMRLKSLNGSNHSVYSSGKMYLVESNAPTGVKHRNRCGEISNPVFKRTIDREGRSIKINNQLAVNSGKNSIDIGDLQISTSKNGLDIGFLSREADLGQMIARRISDSTNPTEILRRSGDVERFFVLEENKRFLIKTKNSKKWMHLDMSEESEVDLQAPWHARVSGNFSDSKISKIEWINEDARFKNLLSQYHINSDSVVENPRGLEFKKPVGNEQELLAEYQDHLKKIDDFMEKGHYSLAITEIDKMISLYGSKDELFLKKGMAQLKESMQRFDDRSYNSATDLLNEALGKKPGLKRRSIFYDDIKPIINNNPSIPSGPKEKIRELIEFQYHPDIKVIISNVDRVPEATRVTPEEFAKMKGKKRLVVQEGLSKSDSDWNVNIESTMFTVLENHPDAILVKIPEEDLSSYRLKLKNTSPYDTTPNYALKLSRNAGYPASTTFTEDDEDDKIAENLYILFVKENEKVCH